MEYCLFGGLLTPLLGFIEELKFKEKTFSEKFMVKSLVENYFFYYQIACQNARNGFSDLLNFACGIRFSRRLLLYLSHLLHNLLRTLHTNCARSVSMVELPIFESTVKFACKVKLEEIICCLLLLLFLHMFHCASFIDSQLTCL